MAHQSLDHEEILNVRWATQDPNPLAQKREARRIEEQAAEAVRRALPAEFIAEIEGRDLNSVKRKRLEGSYGSYAHDSPEGKRAIQSMSQPSLLEGSKDENGTSLAAGEVQLDVAELAGDADQMGGILSNSTLMALKGYSVGRAGEVGASKSTSGLMGSLVGYDSDEDSD